MNRLTNRLRFYFITDDGPVRLSLLEQVQIALAAGAGIVQYRHKNFQAQHFAELQAIRDACRARAVPLLINDQVLLAKAVAADGVHLGQTDDPPHLARQILGAAAIIGLSVSNPQELQSSTLDDCDYIGSGPVFATHTKVDVKPVRGLNGLRQMVTLAPLPVVAIGGVTVENAGACLAQGAAGVAVISALTRAADPVAAAQALAGACGVTPADPLMPTIKTALTIAGSDSSGGAGIQADLKTFQALGVYGMSAITAVTVQNTREVSAIQAIDPQIVHDQITCLFADIPIHAVKIGMVAGTPLIRAIGRALREVTAPPIVLDPVMISKSGYALLAEEARRTLVEELFPLAAVVTPNIHEAQALIGAAITDETAMIAAAQAIHQLGARKVVVKGGHLGGDRAVDIVFDGHRVQRLDAARRTTRHTHGTGCTFSSAIAAYLARGLDFFAAVRAAKDYISGAIEHALAIGQGHGPTHHFYDLYRRAGLPID